MRNLKQSRFGRGRQSTTANRRYLKTGRSSTYRPSLELLENRLVPAVHTWTGASMTSNNWSDPENWSGGAPTAGEANVSLIFSNSVGGSPTRRTSNNDITGLTVSSIQFTENIYTMSFEIAFGYVLTGNAITLAGETLISEKSNTVFQDSDGNTTGTGEGLDAISLPLVERPVFFGFRFFNVHTYEVDPGNVLDISGGITSSANCFLDKTGDGELDLDSPGNNFSDSITIDGGILKLGSVSAANFVPVTVAAGCPASFASIKVFNSCAV
jgi:hypothetical protein